MSVDELRNDELEGMLAVPLIRDIVDILIFATDADLARSGDVELRSMGSVEKVQASSQTVGLLRANGRRRGATITNDATAVLYVKLAHKATADDWTVKLQPDDYYELPARYRGHVSGIWAAGATGQARVTEF